MLNNMHANYVFLTAYFVCYLSLISTNRAEYLEESSEYYDYLEDYDSDSEEYYTARNFVTAGQEILLANLGSEQFEPQSSSYNEQDYEVLNPDIPNTQRESLSSLFNFDTQQKDYLEELDGSFEKEEEPLELYAVPYKEDATKRRTFFNVEHDSKVLKSDAPISRNLFRSRSNIFTEQESEEEQEYEIPNYKRKSLSAPVKFKTGQRGNLYGRSEKVDRTLELNPVAFDEDSKRRAFFDAEQDSEELKYKRPYSAQRFQPMSKFSTEYDSEDLEFAIPNSERKPFSARFTSDEEQTDQRVQLDGSSEEEEQNLQPNPLTYSYRDASKIRAFSNTEQDFEGSKSDVSNTDGHWLSSTSTFSSEEDDSREKLGDSLEQAEKRFGNNPVTYSNRRLASKSQAFSSEQDSKVLKTHVPYYEGEILSGRSTLDKEKTDRSEEIDRSSSKEEQSSELNPVFDSDEDASEQRASSNSEQDSKVLKSHVPNSDGEILSSRSTLDKEKTDRGEEIDGRSSKEEQSLELKAVADNDQDASEQRAFSNSEQDSKVLKSDVPNSEGEILSGRSTLGKGKTDRSEEIDGSSIKEEQSSELDPVFDSGEDAGEQKASSNSEQDSKVLKSDVPNSEGEILSGRSTLDKEKTDRSEEIDGSSIKEEQSSELDPVFDSGEDAGDQKASSTSEQHSEVFKPDAPRSDEKVLLRSAFSIDEDSGVSKSAILTSKAEPLSSILTIETEQRNVGEKLNGSFEWKENSLESSSVKHNDHNASENQQLTLSEEVIQKGPYSQRGLISSAAFWLLSAYFPNVPISILVYLLKSILVPASTSSEPKNQDPEKIQEVIRFLNLWNNETAASDKSPPDSNSSKRVKREEGQELSPMNDFNKLLKPLPNTYPKRVVVGRGPLSQWFPSSIPVSYVQLFQQSKPDKEPSLQKYVVPPSLPESHDIIDKSESLNSAALSILKALGVTVTDGDVPDSSSSLTATKKDKSKQEVHNSEMVTQNDDDKKAFSISHAPVDIPLGRLNSAARSVLLSLRLVEVNASENGDIPDSSSGRSADDQNTDEENKNKHAVGNIFNMTTQSEDDKNAFNISHGLFDTSSDKLISAAKSIPKALGDNVANASQKEDDGLSPNNKTRSGQDVNNAVEMITQSDDNKEAFNISHALVDTPLTRLNITNQSIQQAPKDTVAPASQNKDALDSSDRLNAHGLNTDGKNKSTHDVRNITEVITLSDDDKEAFNISHALADISLGSQTAADLNIDGENKSIHNVSNISEMITQSVYNKEAFNISHAQADISLGGQISSAQSIVNALSDTVANASQNGDVLGSSSDVTAADLKNDGKNKSQHGISNIIEVITQSDDNKEAFNLSYALADVSLRRLNSAAQWILKALKGNVAIASQNGGVLNSSYGLTAADLNIGEENKSIHNVVNITEMVAQSVDNKEAFNISHAQAYISMGGQNSSAQSIVKALSDTVANASKNGDVLGSSSGLTAAGLNTDGENKSKHDVGNITVMITQSVDNKETFNISHAQADISMGGQYSSAQSVLKSLSYTVGNASQNGDVLGSSSGVTAAGLNTDRENKSIHNVVNITEMITQSGDNKEAFNISHAQADISKGGQYSSAQSIVKALSDTVANASKNGDVLGSSFGLTAAGLNTDRENKSKHVVGYIFEIIAQSDDDKVAFNISNAQPDIILGSQNSSAQSVLKSLSYTVGNASQNEDVLESSSGQTVADVRKPDVDNVVEKITQSDYDAESSNGSHVADISSSLSFSDKNTSNGSRNNGKPIREESIPTSSLSSILDYTTMVYNGDNVTVSSPEIDLDILSTTERYDESSVDKSVSTSRSSYNVSVSNVSGLDSTTAITEGDVDFGYSSRDDLKTEIYGNEFTENVSEIDEHVATTTEKYEADSFSRITSGIDLNSFHGTYSEDYLSKNYSINDEVDASTNNVSHATGANLTSVVTRIYPTTDIESSTTLKYLPESDSMSDHKTLNKKHGESVDNTPEKYTHSDRRLSSTTEDYGGSTITEYSLESDFGTTVSQSRLDNTKKTHAKNFINGSDSGSTVERINATMTINGSTLYDMTRAHDGDVITKISSKSDRYVTSMTPSDSGIDTTTFTYSGDALTEIGSESDRPFTTMTSKDSALDVTPETNSEDALTEIGSESDRPFTTLTSKDSALDVTPETYSEDALTEIGSESDRPFTTMTSKDSALDVTPETYSEDALTEIGSESGRPFTTMTSKDSALDVTPETYSEDALTEIGSESDRPFTTMTSKDSALDVTPETYSEDKIDSYSSVKDQKYAAMTVSHSSLDVTTETYSRDAITETGSDSDSHLNTMTSSNSGLEVTHKSYGEEKIANNSAAESRKHSSTTVSTKGFDETTKTYSEDVSIETGAESDSHSAGMTSSEMALNVTPETYNEDEIANNGSAENRKHTTLTVGDIGSDVTANTYSKDPVTETSSESNGHLTTMTLINSGLDMSQKTYGEDSITKNGFTDDKKYSTLTVDDSEIDTTTRIYNADTATETFSENDRLSPNMTSSESALDVSTETYGGDIIANNGPTKNSKHATIAETESGLDVNANNDLSDTIMEIDSETNEILNNMTVVNSGLDKIQGEDSINKNGFTGDRTYSTVTASDGGLEVTTKTYTGDSITKTASESDVHYTTTSSSASGLDVANDTYGEDMITKNRLVGDRRYSTVNVHDSVLDTTTSGDFITETGSKNDIKFSTTPLGDSGLGVKTETYGEDTNYENVFTGETNYSTATASDGGLEVTSKTYSDDAIRETSSESDRHFTTTGDTKYSTATASVDGSDVTTETYSEDANTETAFESKRLSATMNSSESALDVSAKTYGRDIISNNGSTKNREHATVAETESVLDAKANDYFSDTIAEIDSGSNENLDTMTVVNSGFDKIQGEDSINRNGLSGDRTYFTATASDRGLEVTTKTYSEDAIRETGSESDKHFTPTGDTKYATAIASVGGLDVTTMSFSEDANTETAFESKRLSATMNSSESALDVSPATYAEDITSNNGPTKNSEHATMAETESGLDVNADDFFSDTITEIVSDSNENLDIMTVGNSGIDEIHGEDSMNRNGLWGDRTYTTVTASDGGLEVTTKTYTGDSITETASESDVHYTTTYSSTSGLDVANETYEGDMITKNRLVGGRSYSTVNVHDSVLDAMSSGDFIPETGSENDIKFTNTPLSDSGLGVKTGTYGEDTITENVFSGDTKYSTTSASDGGLEVTTKTYSEDVIRETGSESDRHFTSKTPSDSGLGVTTGTSGEESISKSGFKGDTKSSTGTASDGGLEVTTKTYSEDANTETTSESDRLSATMTSSKSALDVLTKTYGRDIISNNGSTKNREHATVAETESGLDVKSNDYFSDTITEIVSDSNENLDIMTVGNWGIDEIHGEDSMNRNGLSGDRTYSSVTASDGGLEVTTKTYTGDSITETASESDVHYTTTISSAIGLDVANDTYGGDMISKNRLVGVRGYSTLNAYDSVLDTTTNTYSGDFNSEAGSENDIKFITMTPSDSGLGVTMGTYGEDTITENVFSGDSEYSTATASDGGLEVTTKTYRDDAMRETGSKSDRHFTATSPSDSGFGVTTGTYGEESISKSGFKGDTKSSTATASDGGLEVTTKTYREDAIRETGSKSDRHFTATSPSDRGFGVTTGTYGEESISKSGFKGDTKSSTGTASDGGLEVTTKTYSEDAITETAFESDGHFTTTTLSESGLDVATETYGGDIDLENHFETNTLATKTGSAGGLTTTASYGEYSATENGSESGSNIDVTTDTVSEVGDIENHNRDNRTKDGYENDRQLAGTTARVSLWDSRPTTKIDDGNEIIDKSSVVTDNHVVRNDLVSSTGSSNENYVTENVSASVSILGDVTHDGNVVTESPKSDFIPANVSVSDGAGASDNNHGLKIPVNGSAENGPSSVKNEPRQKHLSEDDTYMEYVYEIADVNTENEDGNDTGNVGVMDYETNTNRGEDVGN